MNGQRSVFREDTFTAYVFISAFRRLSYAFAKLLIPNDKYMSLERTFLKYRRKQCFSRKLLLWVLLSKAKVFLKF